MLPVNNMRRISTLKFEIYEFVGFSWRLPVRNRLEKRLIGSSERETGKIGWCHLRCRLDIRYIQMYSNIGFARCVRRRSDVNV